MSKPESTPASCTHSSVASASVPPSVPILPFLSDRWWPGGQIVSLFPKLFPHGVYHSSGKQPRTVGDNPFFPLMHTGNWTRGKPFSLTRRQLRLLAVALGIARSAIYSHKARIASQWAKAVEKVFLHQQWDRQSPLLIQGICQRV